MEISCGQRCAVYVFDDNIENDTFILPLLALQVTVFPDHGICIGITYCHVMDDNSCNHFMKSWSFIHQGGNVVELKSLSCFDREVLRDQKDLKMFSSMTILQ
ncbi:transferase family protein [Medicago truncatula]|uniref:Transferase family protein n=1 Tax=Medicago truncatula TaxID=3880 RepID=G7IIA3_MEDTR|nr:transferase family protein [Medicago truncatula]